ncbi:MAG: 2OG-Fe(II) oxygenase [Kofleriaceae bacterium]
MSVVDLRNALDTLEEASCCTGTLRLTERVALALPDGDVGAVDDTSFVDWLLEHSEPAPYGHGKETKLDPKVRSAQRLKARDKVVVHGFDPEAILDEIAAVLSPTRMLSAHLTDVIVYKKGDKFTRHKDTPRAAELIGTLVVGLPIAHTGGTFVVDDGRGAQKFDWSGQPKAGALPWVAVFSDVDHEILPVKSGARVTLVYALHRTARPRSDAKAKQRQALVTKAANALSRQAKWPVLIACGRHVIAEPGAKQPQSIDTLRGADHDIAEALVAAGFRVDVRACIAAIANYNDPQPWPDTEGMFALTRLKAVPPGAVIEELGDEGGNGIEDYILDDVILEQCAIRKTAAAMLVHENAAWALDGMDFGNEGFDALLYSVAALEVTRSKAKAKARPKPKPKAKPKKR